MPGLFTIPLSGLKEGQHTFYFEINNKFFDLFEGSEIEESELVAKVEVEKCSTHCDIIIAITGKVKICCDRCLDMFYHSIACENRLLVKPGKDRNDIDPDILTLAANEHELDLQQHFYEYIYLALPIQRIHPEDKNGESTCDPVMLRKLREHLVTKEKKYDARWNELKKLLNDN